MKPNINELIDGLLPTAPDVESNGTSNSTDKGPVYPELLLYKLSNANKLFSSFQQYTRQFQTETQRSNVAQFSRSQLGLLSAQKAHGWDLVDSEYDGTTTLGKRAAIGKFSSGNTNNLFAWASGDKYISARKLELQNKNTGASTPKERHSTPTPFSSARARPSMTQRITGVVEQESNKFIQDRIQIIKAHHIEQASRKLDERKKREHELYLRRIKNKENEYEEAIKAAIASKDTEKRLLGLLGSLFGIGPKSISSSFVLTMHDENNGVASPEASGKPSIESIRSKGSRPSTPTPRTFLRNANKPAIASKEPSPAPDLPKIDTKSTGDPVLEPVVDPYSPSAYPAAENTLTTSNFASQDLLLL